MLVRCDGRSGIYIENKREYIWCNLWFDLLDKKDFSFDVEEKF